MPFHWVSMNLKKEQQQNQRCRRCGTELTGDTAGGLCPKGDLASGMIPVLLLVARSTSKAVLVHATADTALTA